MVRTRDPEHEEVAESIGAYVVGGLDGSETTRIRRHLERCEQCRMDLADLEGLNELLEAAALAEEPPPELEDKVVSALLRTAAVGVRPFAAAGGSGSARRPIATRRLRMSLSSLGAAAVVVALVAIAVNYQLTRQDSRVEEEAAGPTTAAVPSPASAFRLVAAEQQAFPATGFPSSGSAGPQAPTASSTIRDIAGSQVHPQYNPAYPGGELTPRLLGATWECEITVWGLEPGQLYEVWFKGRKGISSGGSFRVESAGIKTVRVSTGLGFDELDEIVISAEPEDGNPAPNGRAVLRAEIPRLP